MQASRSCLEESNSSYQMDSVSIWFGDDKMKNLSGDISNDIYKRTLNALKGKVSISTKMLKLLMLLDGQTNVGKASQKMNISMNEIRSLLRELIACGLIEVIQEKIEILDSRFYGYLIGQLSRIAGPMAQVMVTDAVLDLGSDLSAFPKSRAPELIDLLGQQLPDGAPKVEFLQNMLRKLKDI
jgi:hypothetical protein